MRTLRFLLVASLPWILPAQPVQTIDGTPPAQALSNDLMETLAPRVPRLEILFNIFKTERAALSPDGTLLAYTLREGDKVSIAIVEVDNPSVMKSKMQVIDDETASVMLASNTKERTPGAVRWMRWVSNTRLVLETNLRVALSDGNDWHNAPTGGAILGMDADGGNARLLCTARDTSDIELDSKSALSWKPSPRDPNVGDPSAPLLSPAELAARNASSPQEPTPESMASEYKSMDLRVAAKSPHVHELIPGDPDHILIRTDPALTESNAMAYQVYRLNVHTGKLKEEAMEYIEAASTTLIDRQARSRISIPISFRDPFPHLFKHNTTSIFSRAKPLDELSGLQDAFRLSPENYHLGNRAVPLAFSDDGLTLYYASNLNRDTFGIYSLNLKTGQPGGLKIENPLYDLYEPREGAFPNHRRNVGDEYQRVLSFGAVDVLPPERDSLVFDRYQRKVVGVRFDGVRTTTVWTEPELHAAQIELEGLMRGSNVEILEWNEGHTRFLVKAYNAAIPGAFYVYDRGASKLFEFVQVEPNITTKNSNMAAEFSFKHPNGELVTGLLTLPRYVRTNPAPLILFCDNRPWERVRSVYHARVQALAQMGFAVAQLSSRAAWGVGLKARSSAPDGAEKAFAEDLNLVADQLCARFKFNRAKVSLYGEELGAFCALWALQLHPDSFRCAVLVNPTLNPAIAVRDARDANGSVLPALEQSYFGGIERLETLNLLKNCDQIKVPLCILQYRGPEGEMRNLAYQDAQSLHHRVSERAPESELHALTMDFQRKLPGAKADAFRNMAGFFNLHVYGFKTKTGETRILDQEEPKK